MGEGLVPKLRFPEFQDAPAWEPRTLEELEQCGLLELGRGEVISARDMAETPGPFPVYSSSVKNDGYMGSYGRYMFDEELISWSVDGGGNFFYRPKHKFSVTNVSGYIRLKTERLGYRFFAAQLQFLHGAHTFDYQLKAHPSVIRKLYCLGIPSPAEQRKIAECLTSLDELIAAEGRRLEALRQWKKALLQNLFPREGETTPRLRFPEFRTAGDWVSRPFGEAATFYNGRAYAKEELLDTGKYKVLRVGNFFTNDKWYYSDLELEETKYCDNGDLLYAWSASFGPQRWHGGRAIFHYHIWKVVEKPAVDRDFLYRAMDVETERMKSRMANGIGMFHITKGTIEAWPAKFPELDEQRRIASCLGSLDTHITEQAKKLDTLKTHKQGLMQGLFPSAEEAA